MTVRTSARFALGLLTGLWVTIGAAIPIGYVSLRLLRTANGGELGPELLARPAVVLALLAGYGVAAAIGGWAAGWVTIVLGLAGAAVVGTIAGVSARARQVAGSGEPVGG